MTKIASSLTFLILPLLCGSLRATAAQELAKPASQAEQAQKAAQPTTPATAPEKPVKPTQAKKANRPAPGSPEAYPADMPKPTQANVPYGSHPRQILDFWKAESSEPTPLAFIIHGGGWQAGSKERAPRHANIKGLLKAGTSVVSINYRLIPQVKDVTPPVKAPLTDAARALQFVRSKAAEWNLDKTRVGAAGGSAGACSSLWLAFHDDMADPKSEDPIARESTRLTCAAVTGAQTTLDPQQMKDWTPNSRYGGHAFGVAAFADFLAARERLLPEIKNYSPFHHVTKDDPAIFLTYSTPPAIGKAEKDPTHTANFGIKLLEECQAKGVACVLHYPQAKDVPYTNPGDFLIAKLKRQ